MLYFLQFSSDDRDISHNAQGQRQGQVKVEAVQALHFEAYRLVLFVLPGYFYTFYWTEFHQIFTVGAPWVGTVQETIWLLGTLSFPSNGQKT